MKKFSSAVGKTLVAATAALLVTAGAAQAVTVTGNLSVTLSGFDGNLPAISTAPTDIKTFNGNQLPTGTSNPVFGTIHKTSSTKYYSNNLDLTIIGTTTYNLLQIDPAATCGNDCAKDTEGTGRNKHTYLTDSGTVTVSFVGTGSDAGQTFTDSGIFSAKYGGATLACAAGDGKSETDTDCIEWNKPTLDTFTAITISLGDAVDWDLVPQITLGIPSKSIGTPLPATLSLFAGGLGVMGLVGRRRKRKNAAALAAA